MGGERQAFAEGSTSVRMATLAFTLTDPTVNITHFNVDETGWGYVSLQDNPIPLVKLQRPHPTDVQLPDSRCRAPIRPSTTNGYGRERRVRQQA